ncbi:uncharacterized protein V1518DRAFT_404658 [Limtongia smithiae]|uniref:uncharacterized protein n=1 Tax=Limtongia smithiae TaxID=1125753 RepID=UPI0034CD8F0A
MLTVLLFSSGVEHGETEDNEDKVGAGDKSLEYSCDIKTDAICYGVSVPKENAAAVESEKEGTLHQMMEIYREGQTPERIGFVDGITPHVQNVIGRGMLLGRAVVRTVDDGVQRAITATYLEHAKKFSNTYRPGNNLDSVISLSDYRVVENQHGEVSLMKRASSAPSGLVTVSEGVNQLFLILKAGCSEVPDDTTIGG